MNNYVDGAAFIDLTEADVKLICKKIGPTKEICHLISQVTNYIYHVSLSDIYLFFIDKEKHQPLPLTTLPSDTNTSPTSLSILSPMSNTTQ